MLSTIEILSIIEELNRKFKHSPEMKIRQEIKKELGLFQEKSLKIQRFRRFYGAGE